jgi:F-type H+-transporting ATPase subunit b
MDMIVTIFGSLGVDKTVFIQFAILLLTFIACTTLFFSRLKEVLDLRETRTTKLEGNAHAIYKKAEELSEQFKAKVEKTHQEAHSAALTKKNEIVNQNKKLIEETEAKLNAEYEAKRAAMYADFNSKKEKSLLEVESLSNSLIEKLTK